MSTCSCEINLCRLTDFFSSNKIYETQYLPLQSHVFSHRLALFGRITTSSNNVISPAQRSERVSHNSDILNVMLSFSTRRAAKRISSLLFPFPPPASSSFIVRYRSNRRRVGPRENMISARSTLRIYFKTSSEWRAKPKRKLIAFIGRQLPRGNILI